MGQLDINVLVDSIERMYLCVSFCPPCLPRPCVHIYNFHKRKLASSDDRIDYVCYVCMCSSSVNDEV